MGSSCARSRSSPVSWAASPYPPALRRRGPRTAAVSFRPSRGRPWTTSARRRSSSPAASPALRPQPASRGWWRTAWSTAVRTGSPTGRAARAGPTAGRAPAGSVVSGRSGACPESRAGRDARACGSSSTRRPPAAHRSRAPRARKVTARPERQARRQPQGPDRAPPLSFRKHSDCTRRLGREVRPGDEARPRRTQPRGRARRAPRFTAGPAIRVRALGATHAAVQLRRASIALAPRP